MDRKLEKRLSDRAVAIGREGNTAAFGELLELLKSSSENARRLSASALGKLAWMGVDQVAAVAALAPVARRDPHAQTRQYAIKALKAYGVASKECLSDLRDMAANLAEKDYIRRDAASAVAFIEEALRIEAEKSVHRCQRCNKQASADEYARSHQAFQRVFCDRCFDEVFLERRNFETQVELNKTIEVRDGTVVQSEGERRIAEWLTSQGVAYRYDAKFRIIGEFQIRPDFYLPELDVYIEYWGLDTPQYKMSMYKKQMLYQQEGKRLISVYPRDLAQLDGLLKSKLSLFGYKVNINKRSEVSRKTRFLKACRCEPVDATPVWLMRQAGRYMPQYRALREKHSLLDLVKNPELAAQVTLQPVEAFEVDAAIIFADILTLPESMGLDLRFTPGEGPAFSNPIRSEEDVARLHIRPPEEGLDFTLEAIRLTRKQLDGKVPLIGFSGAPFTLACYMIEGRASRDFPVARRFIREQPRAWKVLAEKLAQAIGAYLHAQIEAGAQAIQLFDTWAGILSESEYREWAMPYSSRALTAVSASAVPVIHFAIGAHLLPHVKEAGGSVIGVDHHVELADAWRTLGDDIAVQGNLDPALLLGSPEPMRNETVRILDSVRGRRGHIFNLGHGVIKETPVENVAELVHLVHEHSKA